MGDLVGYLQTGPEVFSLVNRVVYEGAHEDGDHLRTQQFLVFPRTPFKYSFIVIIIFIIIIKRM